MKNKIDLLFYPDWAKKLVAEEESGPYSSFHIVNDPIGKNLVNGTEILSFLQGNNLLQKTFNVHDFTHIGKNYFYERFCASGIFNLIGWNSLVENMSGKMYFPKLHLYKQELETIWVPLDSNFLLDMSPIFLKDF